MIPDAFQRQLASKQSPASSSQGVGITLSSPSFGGVPTQDDDFTHGEALPDVIGSAASLSEDFKLWLSRHPGLTFDEALHRYHEEQKQRSRVRLKH